MRGVQHRFPSHSQHVTVLRGAAVLAFQDDGHCVLEDSDVAFAGGVVCHAGGRWEGPAHEVHELPGRLVLPGLISLGTTLTQPVPVGSPGSHRSACEAEYSQCWALARLLRSGVTTILVAGGRIACSESLALSAGELGLRLYHGPDAGGLAEAEAAAAFCRSWEGSFGGRVRTVLCTGSSVRLDAADARVLAGTAADLDLPLFVRVAESAAAFHRRLRGSGTTPLQWLQQHGLLRPGTLLGDCHYLAGERATGFVPDTDIPLLLAAQATACIAPLAAMRQGRSAGLFDRLRERGVRVALTASSEPWDMFDELRAASLGSKVSLGSHAAGTTRAVLDAATVHAADALRRTDLGRVCAGAAADLVVVDLDALRIGPWLDVVRAVVSGADASNVEHVIVDGRFVVRDRRLRAWDESEIVRTMRSVAEGADA